MRVPKYSQQRQAPSSAGFPISTTRMPLADPAASGLDLLANSAGKASDAIQARHEQRQKELDAVAVSQKVSDLRAWERSNIVPMRQLIGADAVGDPNDPEKPSVHSRGVEGYRETIEGLRGGLSERQAELFDQRALLIQDSGLNDLAIHVASQHQVLRKNAYEADLSGAIESASRNHFDVPRIEQSIADLKAQADALYPGLDMSEAKRKAEAAVLVSALKGMQSNSPQIAKTYLEHWKDRIGDNYEKIKDPIQRDSLYDEVTSNPALVGDFDAQEDAAMNSDVPLAVRRTVAGMIRSDEAEKKSRDEAAKKQRRTGGFNSFFKAMDARLFAKAIRIVDNWDVGDFTEQERYLAKEKARTGDIKRSNESAKVGVHIGIKTGKYKTIEDLHAELFSPEMANQLKLADMRALEADWAAEQKDPSNYGPSITALEQRFDRTYNDTDYYGFKPRFRIELLADIAKEEAAKKRKLTTTEILQTGDALLDLHKERTGWWDIGDPNNQWREFDRRMEEAGGEKAKTESLGGGSGAEDVGGQSRQAPTVQQQVDAMPGAIRQEIVSTLQAAGRPIDYRDIWFLFEKHHPAEAEQTIQRLTGGRQ